MIRLTADIDKKNRLYLGYFIMKSLFAIKRIKKVEIRSSPSKKWHLLIYTSYPYTMKEQFRLRKRIGDDAHRLSMDRLRKFGRNVLFYKKENFKDGFS